VSRHSSFRALRIFSLILFSSLVPQWWPSLVSQL